MKKAWQMISKEKIKCISCCENFNKTNKIAYYCKNKNCKSNSNEIYCLKCMLTFYNSQETETSSNILPNCICCLEEICNTDAMKIMFSKTRTDENEKAIDTFLNRLFYLTVTKENSKLNSYRISASKRKKLELSLLDFKIFRVILEFNLINSKMNKTCGEDTYTIKNFKDLIGKNSNSGISKYFEKFEYLKNILNSEIILTTGINECIKDLEINISKFEEISNNAIKELNLELSNCEHGIAPRGTIPCNAPNCIGALIIDVSNPDSILKCVACDKMLCTACETEYTVDHKCNNDNINSVSEMKKITKMCPNCAAPIFKIDGCNEMFCTNCKTCFKWGDLTIQTTNSNPHYRDFVNNSILNIKEPKFNLNLLNGNNDFLINSTGEDNLNMRERMEILSLMLDNVNMPILAEMLRNNLISETVTGFANVINTLLAKKIFYINNGVKYLKNEITEMDWLYQAYKHDFAYYCANLIIIYLTNCYNKFFEIASESYNKVTNQENSGVYRLTEMCENEGIIKIIKECEDCVNMFKLILKFKNYAYPGNVQSKLPIFVRKPNSKIITSIIENSFKNTNMNTYNNKFNISVYMSRSTRNLNIIKLKEFLNSIIK